MMARADNLKPARSENEARELGKKGGLASGAARRKKKTLRETLELLLAMPSEADGTETNMQAVAVALLKEARAGNVQAFTAIRDSIGEKPGDKRTNIHEGGLVITWQD